MPKFAANLTMLFQEAPFLERFSLAAKAGFTGVEYLFPYEWAAEELQAQLQSNQLTQVLFNMPPGDWDAGERGIACHPNRVEEFKTGVESAIHYAQVLQCKQINCLAGLRPDGFSNEEIDLTFRNNLRYAAEKLEDKGITLVIESINSRVDMPGFWLDTSDKGLALVEEMAIPNLRFQFDIYHAQIMEGDVIRRLEAGLNNIGHIQFADNPGRHQPGTGELNFPKVFESLDQMGYTGWVSAEYRPTGKTLESLAWMHA